jgi:hypothetical protein
VARNGQNIETLPRGLADQLFRGMPADIEILRIQAAVRMHLGFQPAFLRFHNFAQSSFPFRLFPVLIGRYSFPDNTDIINSRGWISRVRDKK